MQQPLKIPRLMFFLLVRLLVLILLGLNVRRRDLLPAKGPAIVAANHNSHLDTLVLMSLFPLEKLPRIRPVAAADYFLKTPALAWFSLRILGILPLERGKASKSYDPLQLACEALDRGDIVILFPEGTRGEPEQLSDFKRGIAHLAERRSDAPVTPVFLHGLGKALPKDDCLLVPFFCDVFVGESLSFHGDRNAFMDEFNARFRSLAEEGDFAPWE
jgi:1-acyl-sn-glycerol-3-phosphate acyltransferase